MIKLENFNDDDGHSGEDHIVRPESAVGRFCEETSERRLETLQREIILVITLITWMAVNESIQKGVPRTQFPNRVLSLLGNSVKDQKVVSYQEWLLPTRQVP